VKNLLASLLALLIGKLKYAAVTSFLCNSVFLLFFSLVIVFFFYLSALMSFLFGQAMQSFFCKNCKFKQHQCFACGKLGSSDKFSGAEVWIWCKRMDRFPISYVHHIIFHSSML
jgi:hypothetical protein